MSLITLKTNFKINYNKIEGKNIIIIKDVYIIYCVYVYRMKTKQFIVNTLLKGQNV